MPIRGENIGTAYVRILADGNGLKRSVRDALDDEGVFDEFESSGRKTSVAWREAFEAEMAKAPNQSALRDAIAGPLARGNWLSDNFFRSRNWKNFESGMSKEYGEAGERAVRSLERGLLEGRIDFDALNKRMANILPLITQERINMHREMLDEATRLNEDYDRKQRRLLEDAYRMNAEFDRKERRLLAQSDADFERHIRDRALAVENLREEYGKLLVSTERLAEGERGIHRRDLIRRINTLRLEMKEAGGATDDWNLELQRLERRLINIHPTTDRATRNITKFGDAVGRMTGRGSRNDFLNFFGSLNRNFVMMFSALPRLIGGFRRLTGVFGEARQAALAGGRGGLMSFLAGLGAAGKSGAAGLAALAGGAVILVTMLGPAVALLSALLAIVTALVSSMGFALVGALSAVIGLLVPLGAAAGIAALGFSALDKEQKKVLENNFKPVIDQFRELGDIAASRMFRDLGGLGDNIAAGLERLQPVVRKTADAIRDVGISFGQSLQSRGYRQFVNALEGFLPDATRRLGDIIGNTLAGFGGIFRGMIPFLEDTLRWLDDITTRFAEWANSARGQNAIVEFFEDAKESIEDVGDFLGSIGSLLGELLSSGKDTGDSLFESMADNIREFTEYLQDNPDALEDWFSDAKDIAEDIGELIIAVGKLLDALDSPSARRAVRFFIKIAEGIAMIVPHIPSIEQMSDAIANMMDAFDGGKGGGSGPVRALSAVRGIGRIAQLSSPMISLLAGAVTDLWDAFRNSGPVRAAVRLFQRLPGQIRGALNGIPGMVRGIFERLPGPVQSVLGRIAGFFRGLPARVRGGISSIPGIFRSTIDGLPGQANAILNRVRGFFAGLPGRIRSAISSIPGIFRSAIDGLPGNAASTIDRIRSTFANLPGNIRNALSSIPGIVGGIFDNIVGAIANVPGDIVALFSGLGSRIASAIGSINIPRPNIPDIPGIPDPFATGGLILSRTYAMMGEDGAEAVVPLDRPLSQVDPSVRWLSAIAQGKMPVGGGKTVNVGGVTIVSPNDPHAVARETINTIIGVGY
jgi:phage-related protein